MSIAEIQRFATDVSSNAALRAEIEACAQASQATPADGVIAFAAARGYGFTADELKAKASGREVTDAELDSVAGGFMGLDGLVGFMKWIAIQFGAPSHYGSRSS
jgi:predicted ribosomally synthesized peptide with nif11-like leader